MQDTVFLGKNDSNGTLRKQILFELIDYRESGSPSLLTGSTMRAMPLMMHHKHLNVSYQFTMLYYQTLPNSQFPGL
jgi:hypothetical protein